MIYGSNRGLLEQNTHPLKGKACTMENTKYLSIELNYLKWIISYVTMLPLFASSYPSNFYPVKSCTNLMLKHIPIPVYDNSTACNLVIHCMPDSVDSLGLSCFPPRYISPGMCPYYNMYRGNMDQKSCNPNYGFCPISQYRSPLSVIYGGCYIKEQPVKINRETLTTTNASTQSFREIKLLTTDTLTTKAETTTAAVTTEAISITESKETIKDTEIKCATKGKTLTKIKNKPKISLL